MRSRLALALALLGTFLINVMTVSGQDVDGFNVWTPAELAQTGRPWVEYGNHRVLPAIRRVQSGGGELHKTEADLFVVQAGDATLTVGGELVDAKAVEESERGNGHRRPWRNVQEIDGRCDRAHSGECSASDAAGAWTADHLFRAQDPSDAMR